MVICDTFFNSAFFVLLCGILQGSTAQNEMRTIRTKFKTGSLRILQFCRVPWTPYSCLYSDGLQPGGRPQTSVLRPVTTESYRLPPLPAALFSVFTLSHRGGL
jgi:hypothetical protein